MADTDTTDWALAVRQLSDCLPVAACVCEARGGRGGGARFRGGSRYRYRNSGGGSSGDDVSKVCMSVGRSVFVCLSVLSLIHI